MIIYFDITNTNRVIIIITNIIISTIDIILGLTIIILNIITSNTIVTITHDY